MKPTLFTIDIPGLGLVPFSSYFTFLFLGFFVAVLVVQREARRRGVDPALGVDLGLWVLFAGLLGARLLHVLADGYFWDYVYQCIDPSRVNWGYSQAECVRADWIWLAEESRCIPREADCLLPFKFWQGGLAYYGGLLLAIPVGIYFVSTRKFGLGNGADAAGLALPVGLFFGRIGCFLSGCCFGTVCDLPWGVSFPPGSEASKHQVLLGRQLSELFPELSPYLPFTRSVESLPVHPTQIYEAIACALIFLFLYFVVRRRQRFLGEIFWVSMLLYGVARFLVEFVRDDDRGVFFGWISTSQIIAIPMIVLSTIALIVLPRKLPPFSLEMAKPK